MIERWLNCIFNKKERNMKSILMAGLLLTASSMTSAAVIDFNSIPALTAADGYSEQGVTFTGGTSYFSSSPLGTNAITISGTLDGKVRADIAAGASFVSVDLGDRATDPDRIILSVFDSLDNLLGSVTQDLSSSFYGMVTLSLAYSNIAYATFGTTGELGRGGIYADNFTFTPNAVNPSAVPVPAAAVLFAPALLGFMGLRRRKQA
jgi:hypothetical protein